MQKEGRLFDDLARVANGAMSSMAAFREEAEARIRDHLERAVASMNFVRRDEFEAVREMAIKARAENEALAARIAALEPKARARKSTAKTSPKASAKPAAKATAKRRASKAGAGGGAAK